MLFYFSCTPHPHLIHGNYRESSLLKMAGCVAAIAVFLVTGMAMTRAQVPALGPCPDIKTMHDFNIKRVSRPT